MKWQRYNCEKAQEAFLYVRDQECYMCIYSIFFVAYDIKRDYLGVSYHIFKLLRRVFTSVPAALLLQKGMRNKSHSLQKILNLYY
jgi:hypothetical protein